MYTLYQSEHIVHEAVSTSGTLSSSGISSGISSISSSLSTFIVVADGVVSTSFFVLPSDWSFLTFCSLYAEKQNTRLLYLTKGKKGKDVDLYSASHIQDTSNAHLLHWHWAARPFLGHCTACKHSPAQWPNNRPQAAPASSWAAGLHSDISLIVGTSWNETRKYTCKSYHVGLQTIENGWENHKITGTTLNRFYMCHDMEKVMSMCVLHVTKQQYHFILNIIYRRNVLYLLDCVSAAPQTVQTPSPS